MFGSEVNQRLTSLRSGQQLLLDGPPKADWPGDCSLRMKQWHVGLVANKPVSDTL